MAGYVVRMALDRGVYQGAQPYYTVSHAGRARATRYTPFLDRAQLLLERFAQDITDPSALRAQEETT